MAPDTRAVRVEHANGPARRPGPDGLIDGGDVPPGSSCPVRASFE